MAASPPCCFRLEATWGPHSGVVLRHCRANAAAASSSSSAARALAIGRKKRCWLRLPEDLEVSSVHAEFRFVESGARVVIRDVRSTNGTKLNGTPLMPHQDYPLGSGDLIAVGRTGLRFVQVVHKQSCGEEAEQSTAATASAVLTPSVSPSVTRPAVAPEVIVLDDSAESAEEKEAPASSASASAPVQVSEDISSAAGSSETPADQPDTEPANDEAVLVKPAISVIVSAGKDKKGKVEGDGVELGLAQKAEPSKEGKRRTGVVNAYTPEEATCTACKVVIGQLDLLEQQGHLNECRGGRVGVTFKTAASGVEPKTRKRGNAGGMATRAKKPRKPKTGEDGDGGAAAVPKAKKPRKRKRAGAEENIELALALTSKTKMSKEEQTNMQFAVAKKKLEQLDEQIAKLAKRRVNLVKTLARLERTKEKLRKSQVLPPAKVLQLFDLKAALNAIFPSSRLARPSERRAVNKEHGSAVAKQYVPSRWSDTEVIIDCDEEKQTELAAVAAISMWARSSQQLFGLQRDTLLYRNSVLQAFLGDYEVPDSSIMDLVNMGDGDDEDGGVDIEYEREEESEEKSERKPLPRDHESDPDHAQVPDVVKRVFPNWQRDLAFLHEQTAEELEMALEAMNEAQAQAGAAATSEGGLDQAEGSHTEVGEEHSVASSELATSKSVLSAREEQRLACEYMAQAMMLLIAEKRHCNNDVEPAHRPQQQSPIVLDPVDSSDKVVGQQEQASDIVATSDNEAEKKAYSSVPEELPKVTLGFEQNALDAVHVSDAHQGEIVAEEASKPPYVLEDSQQHQYAGE
ncbi:hypothetical protein PHYPSEUDO_002689 [Phytophthora pseudosyringae]|uniref:FHA domain-containing protein n=1 Tax=Phytophthora pseudosyringae TaxID=221518 RepID=A0A8T1WJ64_9STRA|nr:hypothetical protein PHYPSEUDO_002689 [Phytophthora pseudosyringae]